MRVLRSNHAEEDLVHFLERFATVVTRSKKQRWDFERNWYAAFNGSEKGKGVCGSFVGSRVEVRTTGEAVAAYNDIANDPSNPQYIVIPEIPATIAFECHGRLPRFEDFQQIAAPSGLPFSLTISSIRFDWTLVLASEYPNLEPCFALRPDVDDTFNLDV